MHAGRLELPDIEPEWTPRQREVLDLLVRGCTNGEIAQRLGISLEGAKFHVSEILGKLQVESRDEAAEYWRYRNGLRMRFLRVTRSLAAISLKWAAATVVIVAAAAAVMVAVLLAMNGSDETPALPSETAAPAATATPTPTATPTEAVEASPAPAGALERVIDVPAEPTVWIYADSQPASTDCIEIVADIVPAAAARTVPARPFTCGGGLWRVTFATDGSGPFYLLGVQLLVIAKATLPERWDGTCDAIREHLVPASEPASAAAFLTVCDVQPLARGIRPSEPVVIWAKLPTDLAPATLPPPDTPCWAFSRYLGPPRGATTIDIQCTLE